MNLNSGWHVLYVKPNWEKKVYLNLERMNLESFLPQTKTVTKWSDRKKVAMKPLFPSYVFVKINSSLEFHKALSVDGSYAYIRFGKTYAKVSEKEINHIKLLADDTNISDIEIKANVPKIGDIKKITYGPLNGLECEVIKTGNYKKIIVRIDSLQQNITATIPLYAFENSF